MCLAIPGKIEKITHQSDDSFRSGTVAFGEIRKNINLSMVPEAKVGEYVLVHVGVAISIIDQKEAEKTFELLDRVGEIEDLKKK